MKRPIVLFQIGKSGISSATIDALNTLFEHHKHIRVSFLRASGRTSKTMPSLAKELTDKISVACDYNVIGFVVALRKRPSVAKK